MSSNSNIINHEEIKEFISKLQDGTKPLVSSYIDKTVKNYIYRKAKTKRFYPFLNFKKLSNEKQALIDKGGVFHEVILDSNLYNYLKTAIDYIATLSDVSEESALRISIEDAVSHHETLVDQTNKRSDETEGYITTAIKFKNNYQIVKLEDSRAFQREGKLMRHCVGTYSTSQNIYSLRDEDNTPLITFEVKGNQVSQMRQVCNGIVDKKHYPYVKQFLKLQNLTLAKVVSSNQGGPFEQIIAPGALTFFAFKWTELLLWMGLMGSGPTAQLVANPMLKGALDISLMILAGYKWVDYFANFNPGGRVVSMPQINLEETSDEIPEIEVLVEDKPKISQKH